MTKQMSLALNVDTSLKQEKLRQRRYWRKYYILHGDEWELKKTGKYRNHHPSRIKKPCNTCGRMLSLQPSQIHEFNYCSYECRNKGYSLYRRGEKSSRWKGGRRKAEDGYIEVRLQPDDPFFSMTVGTRAYAKEHRLIMAKHLGRCLFPWEIVHHINGIKDDNRPENLELIPSRGEHNTMMNKYIIKLQKENAALKTKIAGMGKFNV